MNFCPEGLVQALKNSDHSNDGLGCRGYAAENTPIEPVWVMPAEGVAG